MPIEVRSLAEWQSEGIADMLSVLIPAHNEEGHLGDTIRGIIGALSEAGINHEILVVNDNSRDDTDLVLSKLCAEFTQVRYVSNMPPNRFGFAVRRGLAEFRGDAVAVFMADCSDDPADLVRFYRKFQQGYDCVFGSRFMRGGSTIDYPLHKLILNRIGNLLIQILFLLRYNDVTNAFKLYSRNSIAGIQPLLSSEFNLTVEMPLKCIVRGYRYAVVPNSWRNRKQGISKFKIREMGSRYLFVIFYCLLEKMLSGADHQVADPALQLQVWPR
jgi:dolichol-phosphate mannosyltransferase